MASCTRRTVRRDRFTAWPEIVKGAQAGDVDERLGTAARWRLAIARKFGAYLKRNTTGRPVVRRPPHGRLKYFAMQKMTSPQ